jgi:hypothetical protein
MECASGTLPGFLFQDFDEDPDGGPELGRALTGYDDINGSALDFYSICLMHGTLKQ